MHRNAPPMTAATMVEATQRAKAKIQSVLDYAHQLETDPQQEERVARQLCKACFYGPPRLGGAAVTSQPCMCCGEDQMYGSTNTDVLCENCAKDHGLCKHCGGDFEIRTDRKDWPGR